jgi:hypothetical protein
MTSARHLVTVWNPLYTREVEQHLDVLLRWAKRFEEKKADDDDLYVWWGKVKSPNRQQPLRRAPEIRELATELASGNRADEAHLYVTDYRSLNVGELLEIHEGELPAAEREHAPAYYFEQNLACDFWFKLADIRRLVRDDLPEVARELTKLRNVHYNDRPISLYGGMVDIPLVVTRPDGTQFFDPDERDVVTNGALWVEYDSESGAGVKDLQRELRLNVLGEEVWEALDITARASLADAERSFRDHRDDPAHDFASTLLGFAKAVEIQCNSVLRRAAAKLPPATRIANVEGSSRDLARSHNLTIGQLVHVLAGDKDRSTALARVLPKGAWFTGQLPAILDDIRELRNGAAHSSRVSRDDATRWRNRVLGVGTSGLIEELAKTSL